MIDIKTPDQDLFDYFFAWSQQQGYDTYTRLPDSSASYPFVIIGGSQQVSGGTKTSINGNIYQTIDVWGNEDQRLVVSQMTDRFFRTAIGLVETTSYRFFGNISDQSKELMVDTSVPNTALNRGNLTLNLQIM